MKRASSFILALLLSACASARIEELDRELAIQNGKIDELASDLSVSRNAPLILESENTADQFEMFAIIHCDKPSGKRWKKANQDRCKKMHRATLLEKVRAKYFAADFDRVASICADHPEDCADDHYFESLLRNEHNWTVERKRKEARGIASSHYQEAVAEEESRNAAIWAEAAKAMADAYKAGTPQSSP